MKGKSKFHQNDKVNVAVTGKKAKVSGKIKDYTTRPASEKDHSQDWDEITQEAVCRVIDQAVADYLCEVAQR
jgi:hypothetical protein